MGAGPADPPPESGVMGANSDGSFERLDAAAYQAFFEQLPVALVIVGVDQRIRLNRAAEQLYGRSNAEMQAMAFRPEAPWIPEDERDAWAEIRRAVAAGERVEGARFTLVRPSGERRQVEG